MNIIPGLMKSIFFFIKCLSITDKETQISGQNLSDQYIRLLISCSTFVYLEIAKLIHIKKTRNEFLKNDNEGGVSIMSHILLSIWVKRVPPYVLQLQQYCLPYYLSYNWKRIDSFMTFLRALAQREQNQMEWELNSAY